MTIRTIDAGQLPACAEEVRVAALDRDPGPGEPGTYSVLRKRLEAARPKLPPLYQQEMLEPFLAALGEMGEAGYRELLRRDPERESAAGLMMDLAQSLLQHAERYAGTATGAFQEVISDLYDGFLSAEDRRGVKRPDRGVVPPLAKWGNPDFGPYTWPVAATASFGVRAGVVSLPPVNARAGLLAWAALGHETAGHDILGADTGLKEELSRAVRTGLAAAKAGSLLAGYWADRIDETASDVMSILNMGPAAAIGLVGYFRGLNAAYSGTPRLRSEGREDDPHPADILRGYLAAETVRLLSFGNAASWARLVETETGKDLAAVRLAGVSVTAAAARKSASVVAKTIVRAKLSSLEGHSLGEIQDWRDRDEFLVGELQASLAGKNPIRSSPAEGVYAAHAVAAAVTAAIAGKAEPAHLFGRMVSVLASMHDANPSWGPLYVVHPGDLALVRVFPQSS
jgi:hypothetical protein